MDIQQSIQRMFEEIRSYRGNFGDPIVDIIDFDPTKILQSNPKQEEILIGTGIALLVEFSSCIDNSDYQTAVDSKEFRALQNALINRWFANFPIIETAFKCATSSESEFNSSLQEIYRKYVLQPHNST